ncbi:MAG: hypothetical protein ACI4XF_12555 [Oscillospiraceae bacterium]
MENRPLSTTLLIGIALMAAGVLIFVSCFSVLFTYDRTTAVITHVERHEEYDDDGDTTYVYYITACYSVDGEPFTAYGKRNSLRSVGEEVSVYYSRFDHKLYKFEYDINGRLIAGLIFTGIGAVIAVANLVAGVEINFTSED